MASTTDAFNGTIRFSEWLQRCFQSRLWPAFKSAIALPVKVSVHLMAGLVDTKFTSWSMLLATPVAQHVLRACCASREASVGTSIRCNCIPLGRRRMALFTPIIGSVAFSWRRPTTRVFPPLIRLRKPNVLVLMLVIEDNGFLSFGTKLENPFAELLDINDVLIVQPIRYVFNEVSF